jgi:formylglycine-generating enzyme required for sulfatase activity
MFQSIAYKLIAVPGGTVSADIGAPGSPFFNAGTEHVTVPVFYIGETEISYELWYAVRTWATDSARGPNIYTFANAGREGSSGTIGAAPTTAKQEPVTEIGWLDAAVWCNAYSEALGKTPVYKNGGTVLRDSSGTGSVQVEDTINNGFRLPTDAQWEYAARGGVSGASAWAYAYAGSDTIDNVAVYSGNSGNKTAGVKSKDPNSLGLYDMTGNVWEWCEDVYSGANRVIRGGAWNLLAAGCSTLISRYGIDPVAMTTFVGFRVVGSPSSAQ